MKLTLLVDLFFLVALVVGLCVLSTGTKRDKKTAGVVLVLLGALPLWDGAVMLAREYGRWEHGRVASAVVVGKVAADADEKPAKTGYRTRYERRRRVIDFFFTSKGHRFDDFLARLLLTGSLNGWRIQYRYACGTAGFCQPAEVVSREVWTDVRVGQPINVRFATAIPDPGRLDAARQWPTGVIKTAIGCVFGVLAGYLTGRLKVRQTFMSVPAVVTSVDPVTTGGGGWRIGFAYFSACGTACEGADVVYVTGIKLGDNCTAIYPAGQPLLGSLRLG